MNYFFRGQISAKIEPERIVITNTSDPNLVKDTATVTFAPGRFYIKYFRSYDATLRDFTFVRDPDNLTHNIEHIGAVDAVFQGGFTSTIPLAPGESIVIPIQRDTRVLGKNFVVVYDGTVGKERGLAVTTVTRPSNVGWAIGR